MSFREAMRVSPSNADKAIRIEMQLRGYADKLRFEPVIFLTGPHRGKVFNKDKVTRQMLRHNGERVRFTVPESLYEADKRVFYNDGPPHLRRGVKNRDDVIDGLLRQLGFKPTRFRYGVPLSQQREAEICDMMEAFLEEQKQ